MLIGIIFILLFVLASGGQMCFNKFYQQNVENTLVSHYIYLLVMSFLAAICYSSNRYYVFYLCFNGLFGYSCLSNINIDMYGKC